MTRDAVWQRLQAELAGGPLHMTLVDPATTPGPEAARIAAEAVKLGTHALMVGGSTNVTPENVDVLVKTVKADVPDLPVILFPSSAGAFSPRVDALYFLCTLNSTDPRVLVREQARGAPLIKALGTETIPLGYVIVEPGMRVGEVSHAEPLPRSPGGVQQAVGYALAAQYFGMRLVYLEAGSGAPEPVPVDMVSAVRSAIDVPLLVGGGIRTGAQARALLEAGADVLVTGTIAENGHFERLGAVLAEVHARRGAGRRVQEDVQNT